MLGALVRSYQQDMTSHMCIRWAGVVSTVHTTTITSPYAMVVTVISGVETLFVVGLSNIVHKITPSTRELRPCCSPMPDWT